MHIRSRALRSCSFIASFIRRRRNIHGHRHGDIYSPLRCPPFNIISSSNDHSSSSCECCSFRLDYRGRNEQVQLAWRGLRKQLALFVTPKGRGVLFSLNRMAAFLQAGLLLPAQDEALTVQATRKALAKLDADPDQLLK